MKRKVLCQDSSTVSLLTEISFPCFEQAVKESWVESVCELSHCSQSWTEALKRMLLVLL